MTKYFKTFEEYLDFQTFDKNKRYSSYLGITRKEYPRWAGWRILRELESPDIESPELDILVRNFYFIRYLKSKN